MPRKRTALETALQEAKRIKTEVVAMGKAVAKSYRREVRQSIFSRMGGAFKQLILFLHVLTDDDGLVAEYCDQQRRRWKGLSQQQLIDVDEAMVYIHGQRLVPGTDEDIREQIDHKYYVAVVCWMAERALYRDLCYLNSKGISPPAHVLFERFPYGFPLEWQGTKVKHFLEKLASCPSARANWLRKFRAQWLATFRVLPQRPPISDQDIKRKVGNVMNTP